MSSTINTSTGNQPVDPYKAKCFEDPPLQQKVEDMVNFITETKFGMLTTQLSDSNLLTSRCMALAGQEHGGIDLIMHTNLFSSKTMDLTVHPSEVNMSFLDPANGSWASISGTASLVADQETVKKYYSPALKAWLGDLGDGVHDGGPEDPRIGVIKLEAKMATYALTRKGMIGRAVETVKSVTKGDVPAINSLRQLTEQELAELASEIISGGIGAELKDRRRQELIDRLDRARSGALGRDPGNADCAQEVWAALWLCPVDKLEEYVTLIEISPGSLAATSLYTTVVSTDIIKPWLTTRTERSVASSVPGTSVGAASPASPSTPTTASPTTPNPRKKRRLDLSLDTTVSRKGWQAMHHNEEGESLSMFWPPSIIEEWKADVFGGSNTELCANRISVSPEAHVYWGKGYFALKPVSMSEDQKSLELEFYWLRPVPRSSTMLLSNKPSLEGSLDCSAEASYLFDVETNSRIRSGHKLRLETDDPVNRPLPSVKLLKLQWALQRLASLSGAAEAIDVLLDSDDEENDDMVRLYDSPEDFCKVDDVFDDNVL
ncbi:blue light-inducible protein Bli-3 [Aspergillus thermomutatus]|uniref:General stress protein FMN-binding split barrel domain-containing protein n=1 Tax=Aspergillus thermomutatus TaxID=41047 RepID=A0A397G1F6_ASPTH|nr:uncharacterized protein CDV56_103491 [Aspergillus thermomutatus]RHZ44537.1 hypothetical protein CDV56_103491 [Aspergillus thermomutatus]